jgi:hypothetical protein
MPIGLQLYTVGKEMEEDPRGTLKRVAAVGYKEVELSPLSKLKANELRQMLDEAGLTNPSGHYLLSRSATRCVKGLARRSRPRDIARPVLAPFWSSSFSHSSIFEGNTEEAPCHSYLLVNKGGSRSYGPCLECCPRSGSLQRSLNF